MLDKTAISGIFPATQAHFLPLSYGTKNKTR